MADRKATRNDDRHSCKHIRPGPTKHVGGPVNVVGPRDVKINSKDAAIFSDECECFGVGSAPPPKDSIIGGYLKVFIKGQPVARVDEKTYGGSVTEGSPNTVYGDKVVVLGEAAAQWLLEYLKAQSDIPFEHADDGCYGRAHQMKRIMEERFTVKMKKVYIEGDLWPETGTNHVLTGSGVTTGPPTNWGYHICPIVEGVDSNGKPQKWVFDPALSPDRALTIDEWVALAKGPTGTGQVSELPAEYYAPSGGGFVTDLSYTDTNATNKRYSGLVAKGERSTGDPNVATKVSPKSTLGHPNIRPPHMP